MSAHDHVNDLRAGKLLKSINTQGCTSWGGRVGRAGGAGGAGGELVVASLRAVLEWWAGGIEHIHLFDK